MFEIAATARARRSHRQLRLLQWNVLHRHLRSGFRLCQSEPLRLLCALTSPPLLQQQLSLRLTHQRRLLPSASNYAPSASVHVEMS